MTHIPQLRKFLNANNYRIIDEVLISEKNKIYTIIKVACGKNQYENDLDYLVSPFFIKNKDKLLPEYLLKLLNKYKNEINGMKNAADLNVEQLNENIKIIEKLEKLYEVAKDY
jgi:tRNA (adenine22-N1)-methyltransferase